MMNVDNRTIGDTAMMAQSGLPMDTKPLRKAVPVPAEDLRCALRSISDNSARLNMELNSDLNSQLTEKERVLLETKASANESLRAHIQHLCRGVDERVHEETLLRLREEIGEVATGTGTRVGEPTASDESDVWDDIDALMSSDDEPEGGDDDEEIDESEMIDQEAVKRVKALREEVRALSARVGGKMADVTGRAMALASREVEEMRGLGGGSNDLDEDAAGHDEGDPFADDATPTLSNTNAARIESMKEIMSSLSESLAKLEGGNDVLNDAPLPSAVKDLQDTVDTVAANLAKTKLHKEGGDAVLSQTERAIQSKPEREGIAHGGADDGIRSAEARARIDNMQPDERFAAFMASTGGALA